MHRVVHVVLLVAAVFIIALEGPLRARPIQQLLVVVEGRWVYRCASKHMLTVNALYQHESAPSSVNRILRNINREKITEVNGRH